MADDKRAEESINCMWPSWFAPDMHLEAERSHLSHRGLRDDACVVIGKPGREHVLVLITNKPLGLDEMPTAPKRPARVLTPADLDTLLMWLRRLEGDQWFALSTYVDLVAQARQANAGTLKEGSYVRGYPTAPHSTQPTRPPTVPAGSIRASDTLGDASL